MILKNWYKILFGQMCGAPQSGGKLPLGIMDWEEDPCGLVYSSGITLNDIMGSWSKAHNQRGVIFGDGDTPVTADDYLLAGTPITTCNVTHVNYSVGDDQGVTLEKVFTVTNTGSTEFTIREAGIVCGFYSSSNYYNYALVERTVLDVPVTVPPGGVGQVTYRIRAPFPAA